MTLPLLILVAALSMFGLPAIGDDAGGGTPTMTAPAAAAAPGPVDDAGGGTPTHG